MSPALSPAATPSEAFDSLLAAGLWPVALYPHGAKIPGRAAPATGKEPFGKAWGVDRWDRPRWDAAARKIPGLGVGLCLGPGRGPGGAWLVDFEGDGPEAEASLSVLFGGELVDTLGWSSTRGLHRAYLVDGARLQAIQPALKEFEVKGSPTPGVFHLPGLPGLELRIGGYKADGTVKQAHSACPPTVGTDGQPRRWAGPDEVAEVPDAFYATLAGLVAPKIAPAPSLFATRAVAEPAGDNRPSAEARAIAYLAKCDPAIAGSNGHDKTFGVACRVGPGFDLAPAVALRLLLAHWNPTCKPLWSEAELRHKIDEAYQNEGRRGWLLAAERPTTMGTPPGPGPGSGSVGDHPQVEPPIFEVPPLGVKVDLFPVERLDAFLLPPALRPWLLDIARRGCFPLEYPTASALVGLASLVGRNLTIRPKRHDDWTVVPNLWGAIVGSPGMQKTPAVTATLLPIKRLIAVAEAANVEAVARFNRDLLVREMRTAAAKKELAKLVAKKGCPVEIDALAAEAMGTAAESKPPAGRRYVVNDATVEKLGELLAENPRGLLQFRDELGGWFRTMDRQGHESDRGFYLECWDGNGSYTFDRITRGTVQVAALCLSVFGTIQPGPLARYLRGSAAGLDADGFMPRFQILVYPDPPIAFVNVDEEPDSQARSAAYGAFEWLDRIDPGAMGAEYDEARGLHYLRFDAEAQGTFDGWRVELENRLRSDVDGPLLTEHLAKYRSLMPALALIFHLLDCAGADQLAPVGRRPTELAIAWCDFLETHARRAYQSALDGDLELAARLAEKIATGTLIGPFTCRDVTNKGWAGLDTVDVVRSAVGILEDRHWVKVIEKPPGPKGGRPSEQVWINPAVL